jgi:hypothetical protein
LIYNYYCSCNECTIKQYVESDLDGYKIKISDDAKDINKELLVWEESHGITEDPDVNCPICGEKAEKYLRFNSGNFYFRGNCYLDKKGAKKDMALYHLDNPQHGWNPYEEHYVSGEKDHIRNWIKRGYKDPDLSDIEAKAAKILEESKKLDNCIKLVGKENTFVEIHKS